MRRYRSTAERRLPGRPIVVDGGPVPAGPVPVDLAQDAWPLAYADRSGTSRDRFH